MSRKQPVGYKVRRPLTLWGKKRNIGEYLPAEEVASMARIESMVRAGRFVEVFEAPHIKTTKRRGASTTSVVKDEPKVDFPAKPEAPKPEAPKLEEATKPKRKPGRPRKAFKEE